jgi:ribose transport system substrate-binding protein
MSRVLPALVLVLVLGLAVAACGSSSSSSSSSPSGSSSSSSGGEEGGEGLAGAQLTELQERYEALEKQPQTIKSASLGNFTPKSGGSLYLVACDLSQPGCNALAEGVKTGASSIGYELEVCNGGTTTAQLNQCFTNGINAKPSAIIVMGNSVETAGAGYAAAKSAGIPLIGLFASNPPGHTNAEVAGNVCETETQALVDAVIAEGEGNPHAMYVGDTAQQCDKNRTETFVKDYEKTCPSCELVNLAFDYPTLTQSLPGQIEAELRSHPEIDWIVGVTDQVANIAVTQVQQAGLSSKVKVAGMDGNPPNVQLIRQKHIQALDLTVGQGEDGMAAVDAAARVYTGEKVPFEVPVTTFLINEDNVSEVPEETNQWLGPPEYQQQFEELWGK